MPFPIHRMRRLRASESLRNLVRETHLEPSQFIFPLFVVEGEGVRREIGSMPGNYQLSIDELLKECETTERLGIGGVMLFGIPSQKDEAASGAYDENGIVQQAVRALKHALPKLVAITDVCNCEYTSHGHCGKVVDGDVDNDATLEWLAAAAVSHARAGACLLYTSSNCRSSASLGSVRSWRQTPAMPSASVIRKMLFLTCGHSGSAASRSRGRRRRISVVYARRNHAAPRPAARQFTASARENAAISHAFAALSSRFHRDVTMSYSDLTAISA